MGAHPSLIIDFDKVYYSKTYGPFKIIEEIGRYTPPNDKRNRLFVKIKFLNTGTEKIVRYDRAITGKVKDDFYGLDFDKVYYSTYYGPYCITEYLGNNSDSRKIVSIRFFNTGFEYDVTLRAAVSGDVRDYTVEKDERSIDIDTNEIGYDEIIARILKSRWKGMMARCYNPNNQRYQTYGAIGVQVCDYWKDVNNYISSMPNVRYYEKFYQNPLGYQLDKDYLQQNIPFSQRVYSPETCVYLSNSDNSNLSQLMHHNREYFGIKDLQNGTYSVEFNVKGNLTYFGTYRSLDAALNVYQYYYLLYSDFELVPLLNSGFKEMNINDALKYKTT